MNKCVNCVRIKHRTEEEKKDLKRRLKILSGQISGIEQMIDDDRYCDDILIQVSAIINSLRGFGNTVLKDYVATKIVDDLRNGKDGATEEMIDLFKRIN